MSTQDLEKLSSEEVQRYVLTHENTDVRELVLQQREIFGLPMAVIADQIQARKKIQSKVSSFYKTSGIVYPPSINLEQSSSEATARFKADVVSREKGSKTWRVADVTGGFGVDSFFLSGRVHNIDYVEPNRDLLNIVRHNHQLLACVNIQHHGDDAETFLRRANANYDLIYLDPSRRASNARKVFRLNECEPDVSQLLTLLFSLTKLVLVKASPLLDLQQGISELTWVKKVMIVSVDNECKELVFILHKQYSGEPTLETFNLDEHGEVKQFFGYMPAEERDCVVDFAEPQSYLYEPNASILKAGAFKLIGQKFGLKKIHPNTHLYTAHEEIKDFPGRVFKIESMSLDVEQLPEGKANVITRNYPLKAEELKKKLKLADGGKKYVIGFSGARKKYIVLATRLG